MLTLTYVTDTAPGLTRHKSGKSFRYTDSKGKPVTDAATLQRIQTLGIPPAYTDVWICPDPSGHIQATGRDARGRKQYRYHADWTAARDADKFGHMLTFARLLPKLRRRISRDMAQPGLGRNKVLATVVNLLETTLIRVGNEDYARTNKSYGLSTLRDQHVQIKGAELRFRFTGKSGKEWNLKLADKRIAKVVKSCQDIPGQKLFQYLDENGERHPVTSQDVNTYLRDVTGEDVTAKDFRTWAGTVLAAQHLRVAEPATSATMGKRTISEIIKKVSAKLGNTPAICRKCYIHPHVLTCYESGRLPADTRPLPGHTGLRAQEAYVAALLAKTTPKAGPKLKIIQKSSSPRREPPTPAV